MTSGYKMKKIIIQCLNVTLKMSTSIGKERCKGGRGFSATCGSQFQYQKLIRRNPEVEISRLDFVMVPNQTCLELVKN